MIALCGNEYEDIPEKPGKAEYGMYEEGKRTKIKFVWLSRHVREAHLRWGFESVMLTLSNYGAATLDGVPVRGEDDLKTIRELFAKHESLWK